MGYRSTPRLLNECAEVAARKIAQRAKIFRPLQSAGGSRPSSAATMSGGEEEGETDEDEATQLAKAAGGGGAKSSGGSQSNMVQLIPLKKFYLVMRMMHPKIKNDEVLMYYEACREHSLELLRRDLGRMWIRCSGFYDDGYDTLEEKTYFYNRVTGHSQWRLPFRLKTFHSADITLESFIHVMLVNGVLNSSPLHVYFHLAPTDLWPNTEIFFKELEMTRRVPSKQKSSSKKGSMSED